MFVIGGAFRRVAAIIGVGKAVDGVAEDYHVPVNFRITHLAPEGGNLFLRDIRVIGTVTNKHFGPDIVRVSGVWRIEIAVKTDDAFEVGAAAGHFKDNATAETITNSGYFVGVNKRIFFDLLKSGEGSPAHQLPVGAVNGRLFGRFICVGGADAFAVNIDGERDVAEARQLLGPVFDIGADACPFVDDLNRRQFSF